MRTFKNEYILDPCWIKNGIVDHEYQHWILMGAEKKFRDRLAEGNIDSLYELLFHYLNLNGLLVNGHIYDIRLNLIQTDPTLDEVKDQIKKRQGDAIEIVREANKKFSNLVLDYLEERVKILQTMKLFYNNMEVHKQNPIYIILNVSIGDVYDVWKLKIDKRYNFGYNLTKVEDYRIEKIEDRILERIIKEEGNKELVDFNTDKNIVFAQSNIGLDAKEMAFTVKEILLLNKIFTNSDDLFDPNVLAEIYSLLQTRKPLPITLSPFYC